MTIKENLQKAQQQKFLEQLKELEINNQKLIQNNNLLIKTLKDQDLRIVELGNNTKRKRGRFGFLETTLIDLVAFNEKLRSVIELLPKPKESSKKKPNKNKKLELKKQS
jgi:hypothetical protein